MKNYFLLVWLTVVPMTPAWALMISDVKIPDQILMGKKTLVLNGAGVRRAGFAFIKVNVYVAALYLIKKSSEPKQILDSTEPRRMEFTFMRDVIDRDVKEAWNYQFKESVTDKLKYPELPADLKKLTSFMGALKTGEVQAFEMDDTTTRLYVKNQLKGEIIGRNFQKAFLSMWLGEDPAQGNLKDALLGK